MDLEIYIQFQNIDYLIVLQSIHWIVCVINSSKSTIPTIVKLSFPYMTNHSQVGSSTSIIYDNNFNDCSKFVIGNHESHVTAHNVVFAFPIKNKI
jgi:hypothetical protein